MVTRQMQSMNKYRTKDIEMWTKDLTGLDVLASIFSWYEHAGVQHGTIQFLLRTRMFDSVLFLATTPDQFHNPRLYCQLCLNLS